MPSRTTRTKWLIATTWSMLILLCLSTVGTSAGPALETETLRIEFDEHSGATAIRIDGRDLQLSGKHSGFRCTEYSRTSVDPPELLQRLIPGTKDAPGFVPVDMMKPVDTAAAEIMQDADGVFVRVGATEQYGHGAWLEEPGHTEPGSVCRLRWEARIPDSSANFIVYIRVYDEQGNDITEQTSPPRPWKYSPYTNTHYRHLMAPEKTDRWEELTLTYQLPAEAHAFRPAICLFRGPYADIRNVAVHRLAQVSHSTITFETAVCRPQDRRIEWTLTSQSSSLRLQATMQTHKEDALTAHVDVQDLSTPPRPRALYIAYTLPVRLQDWHWWRDWKQTEPLTSASGEHSNTAPLAGHDVSLYPFSAVSRGDIGLAVGVPLDKPAVERRITTAAGISTEFLAGLSPLTTQLGPGTTSADFLIFAFNGNWGFRAAADRFIDIFPNQFEGRAHRQGLWMLAMTPSQLPPEPRDFGFAFWEGWSAKASERELARQLDIAILPYTEVWGIRQFFPDAESAAELPSPAECKETLTEWANDDNDDTRWRGLPRREAARGVLQSLPVQPDGTHPYSVDKYGTWAHWWRTNPDPKLPQPNRATLCWKYMIAPRLPDCDGIYLDSVSENTANYLNVRSDHLALVELPLTFDAETGLPASVAMFHQIAFGRWVSDRLHRQNKIIQANLFGVSHRYHAPLVDVMGSEVGSSGQKRNLHAVESDAICCLRRVYGYRKPVVNLLQEGNFHKPVSALTHEQVRQYIEHQAFYGFYPAISSAGGEEQPGYRNWKRYFKSPELYERDRELFKLFVPIVRELNNAGWQPITGVRCLDNPAIRIERFGEPPQKTFITVRNISDTDTTANLSLEKSIFASGKQHNVPTQVFDLVAGSNHPIDHNDKRDLALSIDIHAWSTRILQVE